jgi:hypothetical protein
MDVFLAAQGRPDERLQPAPDQRDHEHRQQTEDDPATSLRRDPDELDPEELQGPLRPHELDHPLNPHHLLASGPIPQGRCSDRPDLWAMRQPLQLLAAAEPCHPMQPCTAW